MKEITKTEVKESITTIYEITKEELEQIKCEERRKGRNEIIDYLAFALKNYHYKLNLAGIKNLMEDITDFLSRRSNTIRNTYGYSFKDYIYATEDQSDSNYGVHDSESIDTIVCPYCKSNIAYDGRNTFINDDEWFHELYVVCPVCGRRIMLKHINKGC